VLTGQFTNKQTWDQLSRGLTNSQTSQLTNSNFFIVMEKVNYIFALNAEFNPKADIYL